MTDRLAEARARLLTGLEPIMPDRIEPYPLPLTARSVAPRIWVGIATSLPINDGIWTTFPIVAIVDGASHAQYAMLDQLHSRIWDAVERLDNFEATGVTPTDFRLTDPASGIPLPDAPPVKGIVVTARTLIAARTFCRPNEVQSALIPPIPVEVN